MFREKNAELERSLATQREKEQEAEKTFVEFKKKMEEASKKMFDDAKMQVCLVFFAEQLKKRTDEYISYLV